VAGGNWSRSPGPSAAPAYHGRVRLADTASDLALAETAAAVLVQRLGRRPDAAVVLGTGLSTAAEAIGDPVARVDLSTVPGFPTFGAPGHRPQARLVDVAGQAVLVVLGRVHLYEGRRAGEVAHGVRTAVLAGCRTVVLTNAAGALDPAMAVGEPVLIADHLDLTGTAGPLTGPVDGRASGFVELTDTWSRRLRALAAGARPGIRSGVYAQMRGPQFETPAEIRMLRALGADLVGMSTVVEAVAARHLGAELLGVSVVTNLAAGLTAAAVPLEQVAAAGATAGPEVGRLVTAVLTADGR
jgi:purine-nucleoside phosphorylase